MKEYLQAIAELLVIMLDNLYKSWKINQNFHLNSPLGADEILV
jgi:uncharacterized iron-regulated protein